MIGKLDSISASAAESAPSAFCLRRHGPSPSPRSLHRLAATLSVMLTLAMLLRCDNATAQMLHASVSPQQRCLALAMYWESKGEGAEGMRAVGSVVLNRVADEAFPDTVCGVVQDGDETPPCQFSWWCDGVSDEPEEPQPWHLAIGLAGEMLHSRGPDPTKGALFFHSAEIEVPWRIERTPTVHILGHIYYR